MNSNNRIVNMILKYIGVEKIGEMELFINDLSQRRFINFDSPEILNNFFREYLSNFYASHNEDEIRTLRLYTGYEFKNINAILRNNWNYETNGMLTEEKERDLRNFASNMSDMINKLDYIPANIKTYRGVSLSSFKNYGVNSMDDLLSLKGQYYYESGFTSTSLIRNESFFDRKLEYHEPCNIEIEYMIPEECNEVIPLLTDDLSYSKQQRELLINSGSLSKILDVELSDDKTKAYIKVALIPRKIYDKTAYNEIKNSK